MKKVLKLSSLLAAVLLLTMLAGVQVLTAQSAEDIKVNKTHVSNIVTGLMDEAVAVQTNAVLVTVEANLGDAATTSVTVTNKTTKEKKVLNNVLDDAGADAGTDALTSIDPNLSLIHI